MLFHIRLIDRMSDVSNACVMPLVDKVIFFCYFLTAQKVTKNAPMRNYPDASGSPDQAYVLL